MKAKALFNDQLGRWNSGDVGEVLENNFSKYDYFIRFDGTDIIKNLFGTERTISVSREFYFYKYEVELLE